MSDAGGDKNNKTSSTDAQKKPSGASTVPVDENGHPESKDGAPGPGSQAEEKQDKPLDEFDEEADARMLEEERTSDNPLLKMTSLHGRFEVLVEKGRRLVNRDGCGQCLPLKAARYCTCNLIGVSDPMVRVMVGKDTVIRSSTKRNTLNPDWKEFFAVDLCHDAQRITFRVVDVDKIGSQFMGQVSFSAAQIMTQGQVTSGLQGEFPLSHEKHALVDLDTFDSDWNEKNKDKKKRRKKSPYGWITLRIRFTPAKVLVQRQLQLYWDKLKEAEGKKVRKVVENFHPNVIPNTYFRAHAGEHFTFYQSAHQPGTGNIVPQVEMDGGIEPYKARSCWSDLYNCINEAEHFICVCGWSVNPKTRLVRTGPDLESKLSFGDLLKKKADEGVLVYVMVWDDLSSNSLNSVGMMNTFDEKVVSFFRNSKVTCVKVARRDRDGLIESLMDGKLWFTHHQKSIIMDTKPSDAAKLRIRHRKHKHYAKIQAITAFLGGIDITSGRYDDSDKTLFASLRRTHKDDFYQNCLPFKCISKEKGPRQPWQDIHCRVTGSTAVDVLKNFIERWHEQVGHHRVAVRGVCCHRPSWMIYGLKMKKLLSLLKDSCGEAALPRAFLQEVGDFVKNKTETAVNFNSLTNEGGDDDVDDDLSDLSDEGLRELQEDLTELTEEERLRAGSWNADFSRANASLRDDKVAQLIRSIDEDSARLDKRVKAPRLFVDKHMRIDNSIHKGFVHQIRKAKHFLYIESQYFIGSSHLWSADSTCGATNLVPAEITAKICQKIQDEEPFHAYITIPMYPEGLPRDGAVKQILRWQHLTIEMMYTRIAKAIKDKGIQDERKPTDYLSFYFLGNREAEEKDKKQAPPTDGENKEAVDDAEVELQEIPADADDDDYDMAYKSVLKNRRFMVYVHSKMMVVDDEVSIIGSANVNQRSFAGSRDTEIAVCCFETSKQATDESTPRGQVYGFRLSLWAEHLGASVVDEPDFDLTVLQRPGSPECVQLIQSLAQKNWDIYCDDSEAKNVPGHLMRYPYHIVPETGKVEALPNYQSFPDFPRSKILGEKNRTIPAYVTT